MWPDCEIGVKSIPITTHSDRFNAQWRICLRRRTLETNPVAPEALHSLLEEDLTLGGHAGDVVLLPFNGGVHVLEDLLD